MIKLLFGRLWRNDAFIFVVVVIVTIIVIIIIFRRALNSRHVGCRPDLRKIDNFIIKITLNTLMRIR